jgi:hypothetical protein
MNQSLKDWNSNGDISCFEFLDSLSLDENTIMLSFKRKLTKPHIS